MGSFLVSIRLSYFISGFADNGGCTADLFYESIIPTKILFFFDLIEYI